MDASASAVAIAREQAGDLLCRFAVGEIPPVPAGPFDVVLLLETMLAFEDKDTLVGGIAAALRPGGRFAFTLEEGLPLTEEERAAMPDADTVWLTPLDEMTASLERAGLVLTWREDHSLAHRLQAQALTEAFAADAEGIAAQSASAPWTSCWRATGCGSTGSARDRSEVRARGRVALTRDYDRAMPAAPRTTRHSSRKFAQMPWKGATASLFGKVDGICDRHGYKSFDPELTEATFHPKRGSLPTAKLTDAGPLRPPDLIIQDELHLISGPIGSMVGLYETAIDALSTFEFEDTRVRPKVIASTATIRQASEQIRAIFLRQAEIFPPQGLNAEDNFFARQVPLEGPESAPGRLYLGVLARGERLKAVLIRVYVAALAAAQTLYKQYGQAADPYMTLVGYFGSMRELGGTRRLVDDDIKARLLAIDERGLERRPNLNVEELTSRVSSGDIPKVLGALGVAFNPVNEKQWTKKGGQRPIDVLLATNMVSVGVDVPRLGVNGCRRSAQNNGGVHPGNEPCRPGARQARCHHHRLELGPACAISHISSGSGTITQRSISKSRRSPLRLSPLVRLSAGFPGCWLPWSVSARMSSFRTPGPAPSRPTTLPSRRRSPRSCSVRPTPPPPKSGRSSSTRCKFVLLTGQRCLRAVRAAGSGTRVTPKMWRSCVRRMVVPGSGLRASTPYEMSRPRSTWSWSMAGLTTLGSSMRNNHA